MNNYKPKTKKEITDADKNILRSALFILMRVFPDDARRELYNQERKARREQVEKRGDSVYI